MVGIVLFLLLSTSSTILDTKGTDMRSEFPIFLYPLSTVVSYLK